VRSLREQRSNIMFGNIFQKRLRKWKQIGH
jgi:hypothetical protein